MYNNLNIEIMTMNDIKLRWKYDLELQLIEELHADFNSTEKSELRKAELTTLISELIKK
jgi:hypothetical protein